MEDLSVIIFRLIAQAIVIYCYSFFTTKNIGITTFSNKRKVILGICSFLTSVIIELTRLFAPSFIYILCVVPMILISLYILKQKISTCVVSLLILYISISLSEMTGYLITKAIYDNQLIVLANRTQYFFLYAVFKASLIAIEFKLINIYIKGHKEKMIKVLNYFKTKELVLIISLVTAIIFPFILRFKLNILMVDSDMLMLFIAQIFVGTILLYLYFKYTSYYKINKKELRRQQLYNQTLIELVDQLRILKHDYSNIIQAINGYVITEQYDKLKEHMAKLTEETTDIATLQSISPDLINEPAIYGIIASKYFVAARNNIKFNLNVHSSIADISFDFAALSRVIGILLDNAIESATQSEEPSITINFSFNKLKNADIIEIKNSVKEGTHIDINKIFEKGESSKKVKSGLGLWEVRKIISSKRNSQICTEHKNNEFTQTIIIEKI